MSRLAVLFCVFLFAGSVVAQVESLGDVSFALPKSWEYSADTSGKRATLSFALNGQVIALAVFRPLRSNGNADADFRFAWSNTVRTLQVPEPIYEHQSLAGYQGRYASTNTPDNSNYVWLYALETGNSVIPVLVITPNRQAFNTLEPTFSAFVDGVRQLPLKAEAPKTSITIGDLAGEWRSSGDSSLDYVTPSGAYAGSSTVAHSTSYVISPDGIFKSQFAGVANRQIIRGNSVGTVELAAGMISFRERGGKVSRYHFVNYQTAVNGNTVLTLLGDQYTPDAASIGGYAEKWVREPRK
jgi:hypothetical protein